MKTDLEGVSVGLFRCLYLAESVGLYIPYVQDPFVQFQDLLMKLKDPIICL